MATDTTRTAPDDEPLTAADRAAIARALAEPGIAISAEELAALLAAGDDEAIVAARFAAIERAYCWDEPWNRPLPLDDQPL
jgi:hypothetical protein